MRGSVFNQGECNVEWLIHEYKIMGYDMWEDCRLWSEILEERSEEIDIWFGVKIDLSLRNYSNEQFILWS